MSSHRNRTWTRGRAQHRPNLTASEGARRLTVASSFTSSADPISHLRALLKPENASRFAGDGGLCPEWTCPHVLPPLTVFYLTAFPPSEAVSRCEDTFVLIFSWRICTAVSTVALLCLHLGPLRRAAWALE